MIWWYFSSVFFFILDFISEPFLEALPQIHILLILFILNPYVTYYLDEKLFIATFGTSLLTATFGIAKFLKTGPSRLVPDQGPLGGHGTLAFLLLMLNVASTIVSKGIMLAALGWGINDHWIGEPLTMNDSLVVGVWIAICYLPQLVNVGFWYIFHSHQSKSLSALLFQAIIILFSSLGPTKSLKMILQYPAIILTPVFSYWTFGNTISCCKGNSDNKLKVSFRLTWINSIITTFGNLGLFLVHFFSKDLSHYHVLDSFNLFLHIISGSFLVLSWITLIILQNLQNCQKACCSFCQNNQVFQKTALDPNDPDKLIYLTKLVTQEIETEVQVQHTEVNLDHSVLEDIRTLSKKMKNVASGSVFVSDEPKQSKLKSKSNLKKVFINTLQISYQLS